MSGSSVLETHAEELVVLLDEAGQPSGTALKRTVHHDSTPLHLAFSCWVFDEQGRTLLTRRASSKITWPGAWTNTVCGHPTPNESVEEAVRRRTAQELGVELLDLELVLPDFRYRAVMDDGTVENEICPVYRARLAGTVSADPAEVSASAWMPLVDLRAAVDAEPERFSPWMREQLDQLERLAQVAQVDQVNQVDQVEQLERLDAHGRS